mmetsp:Transcript_164200/g.399066  ORF Transcript_164200/g.399066 Transcript_164200/m.399066 type:complete len:258 (-) Transcript_164200:388-1161(-)
MPGGWWRLPGLEEPAARRRTRPRQAWLRQGGRCCGHRALDGRAGREHRDVLPAGPAGLQGGALVHLRAAEALQQEGGPDVRGALPRPSRLLLQDHKHQRPSDALPRQLEYLPARLPGLVHQLRQRRQLHALRHTAGSSRLRHPQHPQEEALQDEQQPSGAGLRRLRPVQRAPLPKRSCACPEHLRLCGQQPDHVRGGERGHLHDGDADEGPGHGPDAGTASLPAARERRLGEAIHDCGESGTDAGAGGPAPEDRQGV